MSTTLTKRYRAQLTKRSDPQKGTVKGVSNHDGHLIYEREGSGHLMSSTEKLALVETTRLKTRANRLFQFDLNLKDLLSFNSVSEIIKRY